MRINAWTCELLIWHDFVQDSVGFAILTVMAFLHSSTNQRAILCTVFTPNVHSLTFVFLLLLAYFTCMCVILVRVLCTSVVTHTKRLTLETGCTQLEICERLHTFVMLLKRVVQLHMPHVLYCLCFLSTNTGPAAAVDKIIHYILLT